MYASYQAAAWGCLGSRVMEYWAQALILRPLVSECFRVKPSGLRDCNGSAIAVHLSLGIGETCLTSRLRCKTHTHTHAHTPARAHVPPWPVGKQKGQKAPKPTG